MTHDEKREADPVVERQKREYEAMMRRYVGSDLHTRKFRLMQYLTGFNGAYCETRCTPAGDLRAILALPPETSEIGADMVLVPRKWNQEMYAVYHGRQDYAQPGRALCISDWWSHFILAASPSAVSAAPTPQAEQTLDPDGYLWKWVERGLFDKVTTAKEALEVLAYHPSAPWNNGRWDVDHKPYATAFYAKFPKADEPDTSGYAEWADDAGKGDGA